MVYNPACTYRIQFNKDFSFDAFEHVIDYFKKLGVQTMYASPIFKAVAGSMHGYDGLNPLEINAEIGSLEQLKNISTKLKKENIGWLQDIVPNHMAFHHDNEWLMDVLEKGPQSAFAYFFDIDWQSNVHGGKLMVPFLGESVNDAIRNNELKIAYENSRFVLKYYDNFYLLNFSSYTLILESCEEGPLQSLRSLLEQIPPARQMDDTDVSAKQWDELLLQLATLQTNNETSQGIDCCLDKINNDKDLLQKIADEQFYVLCHWQETDTKINYRRFFTVNGLICLNIQDENVFKQYHQLIKSLIDEGIFQGLRVDHIDGLYDPAVYLQRLKELTGEQTYITVEKILQLGESLPAQWKTEGSTGYDFLAFVNNLFTNKKNEPAFSNFYEELTGNYNSAWDEMLEKKIIHSLPAHGWGIGKSLSIADSFN